MTYNIKAEREKIENKRFSLVKDLTILAGSIFGLSIAIATKDSVNARFITGEFFLFLAITSGIMLLYSILSGEDFLHFMLASINLRVDLPKKADGYSDSVIKAQEILIKDYDERMKKSQKGLLFPPLRILKIDFFYLFFYLTFLIGVFLIFFSLIKL